LHNFSLLLPVLVNKKFTNDDKGGHAPMSPLAMSLSTYKLSTKGFAQTIDLVVKLNNWAK